MSSLGPSGLTISSLPTLVAELTAAMQVIYGADINVDSNSPDGQLINAFCQTASDTLELIQSVYASFGFMSAYGTQLDERVAIMGIARHSGTYTTTPVLITVSRALTLYGLDQTARPVFTVADQSGNQFQLVATKVFAGIGSASLVFQAMSIGVVQVSANAITNQVTTVLGVASVNNPVVSVTTTGTTVSMSPVITAIPSTTNMTAGQEISGTNVPAGSTIVSVDSATQITISANATGSGSGVTITAGTAAVITGVAEETDTQLKVRAAQSFALAATGPADAVSAALLAYDDVTDAFVVENYTDGEVAGTAAHSIWCIVSGGTDAEIGQAIYAKKGVGCGMRGANSYTITRPNGTSFVAQWDDAIAEPLYISFTIRPRVAGQSFDTTLIAQQLAAALVYKLGQDPTVGDIVSAMAIIAPTSYQIDLGVSTDGISYLDVVTPTTAQYYFTVSAANILIGT